MNFLIRPSSDDLTLDSCARMMSESEPWITLKRDYEGCRLAMRGDYKEVYVATENGSGELLGFIVLQMAGVFKGYIQSICVSPQAQGIGLGTALIQFAEKRIFSESPNVFMLVSSFNERAFNLYTRLGFQKIGTLQNFVMDGFDEFLLRKTIGPMNSFQKKEK
jgi:ribosomal protein S18 acetylase RimI-like enzyme